uniref:agglutinin-like protein 9 isoform X2 n=1 Tax=Styela clava TaxID=7725 RepID=UPI00193966BF|nr:agglutinin-like protein 9 isoform X2 [Styela clava]
MATKGCSVAAIIFISLFVNTSHGQNISTEGTPTTLLTTAGTVNTGNATILPTTAETVNTANITGLSATEDPSNVTTTTITTTINPSACDDCQHGTCEIETGGECVCNDGYTGENCDKTLSCEENAVLRDSSSLQSCNATSSTAVDSTVVFSQTNIGESSSANENCTTCEGHTVPVGRYSCVLENEAAVWKGEPTWIDCTEPLSSKPLDEQAEYIATATSDPDLLTPDLVDDTVTVLETVSKQTDLPQETADDLLSSVNNLMLAENKESKAAVEENWKSILENVDNTAKNVKLSTVTRATQSEYTDTQSNLALGVISDPSADIYYGTKESISGSNSNLAALSPAFHSSVPEGSFMKSKASGSGRISFKMYVAENNLFEEAIDVKIVKVVLSVSGTDSFTLNFETEREYLITDSINGRINNTFALDCSRWERSNSSWIAGQCTSRKTNGKYVSCDCSRSGEYILREISIEPVDNSLSPGAIAGIVIGAVVGVALIGGVIYYCCVSKKKKKSPKVDPNDEGNENRPKSTQQSVNDAFDEDEP